MTMRQAAGGAGDIDEPERGLDDQVTEDPAGRTEPYVQGPTGRAPVSSELRGDPGAEGDRQGEGGAVAGAIAGTSLAGPVGGVVGAVAGGALGAVADEGDEAAFEERLEPPADQRRETTGRA
jgi:hypothetical protein